MIEHCLTSQYIISVAPILGDAIKAYHVDSQSDACGKVAGCDVLEKVQYFDFKKDTFLRKDAMQDFYDYIKGFFFGSASFLVTEAFREARRSHCFRQL